MTKWAAGFSVLVLVTVTGSPAFSPVAAGPKFSKGHKHSLLAAQGTISRDQAAATARSATGGRVLSVDSQQRRGRLVYRVKVLLKGGRVRVVNVDGQSGELTR